MKWLEMKLIAAASIMELRPVKKSTKAFASKFNALCCDKSLG